MAEQTFPWSVPLAIAEISPAGVHRDLAAGSSERAALARIAGLNGISSLSASLDVTPQAGDRFRVTGTVRGQVSQTCVVSLEPVENEIDEEVDVIFAPEHDAEAARVRLAAADQDGDGSQEDPPEPIRGGVIDLGNLACELFVLGIVPYPRRPGATFEPVLTAPDPADHPFAALAALKGAPEGEPAKASKPPAKPKRPG